MMRWLWRFSLFLGFLPSPLTAEEQQFPDKYARIYQEKVEERFNKSGISEYLADRRAFMKSQQLSEDEEYAWLRWLAGNTDDIKERNALCQQIKIEPDDFELQSLCLSFSDQPLKEKREGLERIFEEAVRRYDESRAASKIASYLLDILWMQNDVAAARALYKKALRYTPVGDIASIRTLKQNLALIYTNTSNPRNVVEDGIKLYDELEDYYLKQREIDTDSVYLLAYNKGIAKLNSLEDYQGALEQFERLPADYRLRTDASLMSALCLISLNRLADARAMLKTIHFTGYPDSERIPFLRCYEAIVRKKLGLTASMDLCVQLPADTQANRVMHITNILSRTDLDPSIELDLWRQYWRFYKEKIIPQLQFQTDAQVTAMELERARAESQIKDLELKNVKLLKVLLAVATIALLLGVALFLRLRKKNLKIEKLQRYIHKSVLCRFLPPLLVEEIIQGKSRIESRPSEELITVLFSDMVGFTSLAHQLGAANSSEILNRFMKTTSEAIYRHGGTIDKFVGDAVMVIFGAPLPLLARGQAEKAVACAVDIMQAMERMHEECYREFGISIDVRIGIHQGSAVVGTFGDEKRSDYTAIGPTVNLASRIEGTAIPHQILVSHEVAQHLPQGVVERRGAFQLKGIPEDVVLFALDATRWSAFERERAPANP